MNEPLNASEARAQFFQLLERLARLPDDVVLIRHRDLGARFALMSESRWRGVEAAARLLKSGSPGPFRLAGSAELLTSPEDLDATLERLGKDWDEQVESEWEEG